MDDQVIPPPTLVLLDAIGVFACVLTPEGLVIGASRAALDRGGLTRAEVARRPFWSCGWWSPAEEAQVRLRDAAARAASGETVRLLERLRLGDGGLAEAELTLAPAADADGRIRWIVASAVERQAREAAPPPAAPTRELAHRVKNALATVGAVLSLQARGAGPEIRAALDEAGRRVMAIADVHDAFGRASDPGRIGAADFLGRICDRAGALKPGIAVALEADPAILIEGDRAAALGLLISELLTNAVEQAEPAARDGCVAVSLRREGDALTASVEDRGLGLDAGWPAGSGALGARIVDALTAQLGGRLEVGPGPAGGVRVILRLPARRA